MTILNYTINYVDIIFIAIFLISVIIGYNKGMFLSIINIIRYVLGFSLCFYCSENLTEPIYQMFIRDRALDYINNKMVSSTNIDETLTSINDFKASIPPFLSNGLDLDVVVPTTGDISTFILENMLEPVVLSITKAVIFVVIFLLFFVATGIIVFLATKGIKRRDKKRKQKSKRPTLTRRTDKLLGAVFGAGKSIVLILAICSVLSFVVEFITPDSSVLVQIENSFLLSLINSSNPFSY